MYFPVDDIVEYWGGDADIAPERTFTHVCKLQHTSGEESTAHAYEMGFKATNGYGKVVNNVRDDGEKYEYGSFIKYPTYNCQYCQNFVIISANAGSTATTSYATYGMASSWAKMQWPRADWWRKNDYTPVNMNTCGSNCFNSCNSGCYNKCNSQN